LKAMVRSPLARSSGVCGWAHGHPTTSNAAFSEDGPQAFTPVTGPMCSG
jgi:hypothetical protein